MPTSGALTRVLAGPRAGDVVLALVVAAIGQFEVWFAPAHFAQIVGPSIAVSVAYLVAALALAWRRAAPMATMAVVAGSLSLEAIVFGASEGLGSFIPLLVAYYSVGRYCATRAFFVGSALVVASIVAHDANDPGYEFAGDTVTFWLILLAGGVIGVLLRARAIEAMTLRNTAAAQAAAAATAERARISHEMHDIVGHGLTLTVLQLVTAQETLAHGDVDDTRIRLGNAEGAARDALNEMRRLVQVLEPDRPTNASPQPGLGDIPDLVESVRRSGVDVALAWHSPPAVPPGLGLAAYRVVQEALTNVVKHAQPSDGAVVTVEAPGQALVIEVRDRGRGPSDTTSGRGLAGMRERVSLYGGNFVAGSVPGDGFRVRAEFPLAAGTA